MTSGAPLLHWSQPNQITPIQQQLLELQAMQQYYPISPLSMDTLTNQPQPIIIILPEEQTKSDANVDPKNGHQYDQQLKAKTKDEDDSVVIDAEPIPTIDGRKAIIMLPNGRFSIGDFISAIPFLPIEINVPDTISWIGSGISGIISGIGQRLPFRRPTPNTVSDILAEANIDDMKTNAQYNPVIVKPLVMLPFGGKRLIFPTQF
ncbi:hypothetical protein KGM_211382 [Danaus plexippus plexippus]|uniref:Uncharacterized protein n=1 Tax=Danaus plexippus plexippus TaxID=278856 RepID=A0A212FGF4_DANPL|nr:hypothetical protein KGM_211382 [Danaus plexippus plexippus]